MNVLLVEDDEVLGRSLQKGLQEEGHACAWARSGEKGYQQAQTQQSNVLILDLMLPDMGGLDVLQKLREQGIQTPTLILTALGSVEDRVAGLQQGADDYLVKPFSFPELLARLAAITRRSLKLNSQNLKVGPLSLDLSLRRAVREDREIELTPTEFSLLEFMMRHDGQVVTRKMLCTHLWDEDWEGVTNVVEVHISRLRAKIDREFDSPMMHTVRGRGYVIRGA